MLEHLIRPLQSLPKLASLSRSRVQNLASHTSLGPCLDRLDEASDEFCRIVDTCSAVFHLHPELDARTMAHEITVSYSSQIRQISQDPMLYHQLKQEHENLTDRESVAVSKSLISEFEWDGALIASSQGRSQVLDMQNELGMLELMWNNSSFSESFEHAESVFRLRDRIASMLGFKSHAHLVTSKHSLGNPDKVRKFLLDLKLEQKDEEASPLTTLRLPSLDLSIDNCITGLQYIASNVFNLLLVQSPSTKQSYHDSIKHLAVYSPQFSSKIGDLLLDLSPRLNKSSDASLFPLQARLFNHPARTSACIIAMNLASDHDSLRTLLHEFGHALHHLCSLTKYQHLSGTRGPTDLVEIPSLILERMAWEPHLVARFDPKNKELQNLGEIRLQTNKKDLETQIRLAEFDQDCCGEYASKQTYKQVWKKHFPFSNVEEQKIIPHLKGHYAGCYYSYAFSHAVSSDVYVELFEKDAQMGGRKLHDVLLSTGGTKNVDALVLELLGRKLNLKRAWE